MNSEIIRTFITLSEEKSYVKAAYSLFVTQPTVTKRIKELESEMGKTLFNKCKCQYINVQKVENKNVHFPAIPLSGFQQRRACLSSDMTVL